MTFGYGYGVNAADMLDWNAIAVNDYGLTAPGYSFMGPRTTVVAPAPAPVVNHYVPQKNDVYVPQKKDNTKTILGLSGIAAATILGLVAMRKGLSGKALKAANKRISELENRIVVFQRGARNLAKQVIEKNKIIKGNNIKIADLGNKITALESKIGELTGENKALFEAIKKNLRKIRKEHEQAIEGYEALIKSVKKDAANSLSHKNEVIKYQQDMIAKLAKELEHVQGQYTKLQKYTVSQAGKKAKSDAIARKAFAENNINKKEVGNLNDKLANNEAKLAELEGVNVKNAQLEEALENANANVGQLTERLANKKEQVGKLYKAIDGKNAKISELENQIVGKEIELSKLERNLAARDMIIAGKDVQLGKAGQNIAINKSEIDKLTSEVVAAKEEKIAISKLYANLKSYIVNVLLGKKNNSISVTRNAIAGNKANEGYIEYLESQVKKLNTENKSLGNLLSDAWTKLTSRFGGKFQMRNEFLKDVATRLKNGDAEVIEFLKRNNIQIPKRTTSSNVETTYKNLQKAFHSARKAGLATDKELIDSLLKRKFSEIPNYLTK